MLCSPLCAYRQWAHVKSISVSEAHRGRGLGPLLFTELFAFAARLGIPEVRLEAEVSACLSFLIML
jgi:ribosomal protein S18 acetylase RimI-like enzyme